MGYRDVDDRDDDVDDDRESPDEADLDGDDDGDDETIACPHCHRRVHEEAEVCPGCGNYLSREDAPSGRRPGWFVAGVVLCLAIVLAWVLLG